MPMDKTRMRLTVKLKLGMVTGAVIALSLITTCLGISSLANLNDNLQSVIHLPTERLALSLELAKELLAVQHAEKTMLLANSKAEASATVTGKPIWDAALDAWKRLKALQDTVIEAVHKSVKTKARDISMGPERVAMADARDGPQRLIDLNHKRLQEAQFAPQQEHQNARLLLIAVAARAGKLARAVAVGDLGQELTISGNDEITDMVDALNQMTANPRATATDAADNAAQSEQLQSGLAYFRYDKRASGTASPAAEAPAPRPVVKIRPTRFKPARKESAGRDGFTLNLTNGGGQRDAEFERM